MMLRIGMIGEYPTDTESIAKLLNKKYSQTARFFNLIYDVHGSNLDNPKIKHQLRREYQIERPDFVLFIRDLDGFETEEHLISEKKRKFLEFNSVVDKKGILLLNIFELEAILLSNIEIINSHYSVQIEEIEDCMMILSPKEFIKNKVSKYTTGDNPELFAKLDYGQVLLNCRYFRQFDQKFNQYFNNCN